MTKKGKRAIVFIASCVAFAKELAWATRGEWDGFNAVLLLNPDVIAMEAIADLFEAEFGYKAEFCRAGDICFILDTNSRTSEKFSFFTKLMTPEGQEEMKIPVFLNEPRPGKSTYESIFINLFGGDKLTSSPLNRKAI